MPTYRFLTAEDKPALVNFWNAVGRQQLANQGHYTEPLPPTILQQPQSSWAAAFDDSGNLRGVLEVVVNKRTMAMAWLAAFAIDGSISLRSIREHRDAMCDLIGRRLGGAFPIEVRGVRPESTIAREYLDAHFTKRTDPSGISDYKGTADQMVIA